VDGLIVSLHPHAIAVEDDGGRGVAVEAAGKSPMCTVVVLEATAEALGGLIWDGDVEAGT
jgi:PTS system N-acetylglucosamine-specific IIA component